MKMKKKVVYMMWTFLHGILNQKCYKIMLIVAIPQIYLQDNRTIKYFARAFFV